MMVLKSIIDEVLKSNRFKTALSSSNVKGLVGALKSIFIALKSRPILVITNTPEDIGSDLMLLLGQYSGMQEDSLNGTYSDKICVVPTWSEDVPPPPEIISSKLVAINHFLKSDKFIVVTADHSNYPLPKEVASQILTISRGDSISMEEFINRMDALGYTRVGTVTEQGEIGIRGGIIDIFSFGHKYPLRIEFFGDEIVSIRYFDPVTQRSIRRVPTTDIFPTRLPQGNSSLKEYIKDNTVVILDGIEADFKNSIYLGNGYDVGARSSYQGDIRIFKRTLESLSSYNISVLCENDGERKRIVELFSDFPIHVDIAPIRAGFILDDIKLAVFTDSDIFGHIKSIRPKHPFKGKGIPLEDLRALHPKDYVVHVDYGIGIYEGLTKIAVDGVETDALLITYKDGDKLYVPINKMKYVERYIGSSAKPPELTKLGRGSWERRKKKVKKGIEEYASKLLMLYAEREMSTGFAFSPDTVWQTELEASFPYEETEDQLKVINEIKRDMERPHPMDRLVCGEVGYGKTEIALRAAFKAVMDSKQVCFLVPTTILAEQHFRTFKERLKEFPVKVEMLSRFNTKAKEREIIQSIRDGTLDIVIGTHRLLSKDVKFKDLGLFIVDEEHRFGVKQKELLKEKKKEVDCLSLTATPIPRTLYMSLTRIKDFSTLETPPKGRLSIITQVSKWDDGLIENAILREITRDGQVYFVHNRVESIDYYASLISRMNPTFKVGVAHGEMKEAELERIMLEFLAGNINVLVTTAIIGSGIDIPRVNTIIINRADRFGLAELHQLRGRVGRSDRRAYCYLIVPHKITEDARRRLSAITTFTELGSGLKLALRDLEIRGAGNLLGREQHGHIQSIGYELYTKLLEETIKKLRGEKLEEKVEPILRFDVDAYIPDSYADPERKIGLYKRLASFENLQEVREFRDELIDRFGYLPHPVESLLLSNEIRIIASKLGIKNITVRDSEAIFEFIKERIPSKGIVKRMFSNDVIEFKMRDGLVVRIRFKERGKKGLELIKNILQRVK